MPIFDCTPEKLAELFSANTGLYNSLLSSLRALQKRGVLDKGLEATLKEDLKIIFKAGQVSTSSSYFAFNTYDSWAERQSGLSEGMTLYQHVNGRLIEKLGLSSNGVPSEETITTFLKRPHRICFNPLTALPYSNVRATFICGKRCVALSIGPATNSGKKLTNTL